MPSGVDFPASSAKAQFREFVEFCEGRSGRTFATSQEVHAFSVEHFREFWRLFLEWADPARSGDPEPVCDGDDLETATFFPSLDLSYAENLLEPRAPGEDEGVPLVPRHGDGGREQLTRRELRERVRRLAAHLHQLGIGRGGRVVAIAANDSEAVIAALATATLGATFSSAAPEMGAPAILSRFEQLSPKL